MNILAENVLIEPQSNEKVVGGVIIPDTVRTSQKDGIVVTAGDKTEVKEGDRVIFNMSSATKVVIDENEYYLMKGYKILYIY